MPESINPATGETITRYDPMDWSAVERILGKVACAAGDWAEAALPERARKMAALTDVLDRRCAELAKIITLEMGKPIRESRAEIEKCAWVCRYYAEHGPRFLEDEAVPSESGRRLVCFQPLGVVLGVMPWNFPFWQVFRFAAPTLTAGNGAVLKHASNVTGCALAIESVFREAGFPEHLFRTVVTGSDVIEKAIHSDHIAAVTLTGSEPAGAAVAAAAGKAIKKSVLELGGSDPYLVLEDADLDHAAETCAQSRLINCGQSCIAAKRFIVHTAVKDAFTDKFVARMAARKMGDPLDESTDLGPLARPDLREDLARQVKESLDAGARLLLGGEAPEGPGNFYPPTVLDDVRPGMPAADEELFGPVAAILTAPSDEEALRLANASRFGLGAAIFTRDLKKGEAMARRIRAGTCAVNDFVKSDPRLPFGGIRRSGYGRELARYGIREFVNIQSVVVVDGEGREA